VQPQRSHRPLRQRHRVTVGADAAAVEHLLPVLADVATNAATALADAITLTTADGNAIVSISQPVSPQAIRMHILRGMWI
jgi:hypothetical protein